MSLGERQRLRLFVWRDPFERFVSCLVYVPREAFSTDLRVKFQRILLQAFSGTVLDFDVSLSDAALARIHFTVRTTPGQVPAFDRAEIERQLAAAARRWDDELRDALVETQGEGSRLVAVQALGRGLSAGLPRPGRRRATPCPTCASSTALSPQSPLGAGALSAGRRATRARWA